MEDSIQGLDQNQHPYDTWRGGGQETGSAGDTKAGQLSVSSYNGLLGDQQTLLRPEGEKGKGKKIYPAA